MKYRTRVRGTQASKPEDFQKTTYCIYARANIKRIEEEANGDETGFIGWEYEEVEMSLAEYDALLDLHTGHFSNWTSALRCAERRARYERMDPKVHSLERQMRVLNAQGDSEEYAEVEARLLKIHRYCIAVTDTQNQEGFPERVVYPDEPNLDD